MIDATEEDDFEGDSQQVVNDMATTNLPQSDHVSETDEVETQHQDAEIVAGDIGSQNEFDTAEPDHMPALSRAILSYPKIVLGPFQAA